MSGLHCKYEGLIIWIVHELERLSSVNLLRWPTVYFREAAYNQYSMKKIWMHKYSSVLRNSSVKQLGHHDGLLASRGFPDRTRIRKNVILFLRLPAVIFWCADCLFVLGYNPLYKLYRGQFVVSLVCVKDPETHKSSTHYISHRVLGEYLITWIGLCLRGFFLMSNRATFEEYGSYMTMLLLNHYTGVISNLNPRVGVPLCNIIIVINPTADLDAILLTGCDTIYRS
ncbi:hypothetical protein K501DRAFT_276171 [Backusella circina FSU 941]|nr:hypothetical protein K501DRAFT_276171 [Backusella circina FSU 941]